MLDSSPAPRPDLLLTLSANLTWTSSRKSSEIVRALGAGAHLERRVEATTSPAPLTPTLPPPQVSAAPSLSCPRPDTCPVQRSGISSPDDAFPSPSANRGRADSAARKPLPPNSKARISLEQENYARNSAAAHDASLQSSHATRLPIAEEVRPRLCQPPSNHSLFLQFTSPSRYATAQTTVTLGNASAADNAAASSRLNGDTAPLHSGVRLHDSAMPQI